MKHEKIQDLGRHSREMPECAQYSANSLLHGCSANAMMLLTAYMLHQRQLNTQAPRQQHMRTISRPTLKWLKHKNEEKITKSAIKMTRLESRRVNVNIRKHTLHNTTFTSRNNFYYVFQQIVSTQPLRTRRPALTSPLVHVLICLIIIMLKT